MSEEISPMQFGEMRAQIEILQNSVEKLEKSVEDLTKALSELHGGTKLLVSIGAVIAALSSAATWAISHLRFTP